MMNKSYTGTDTPLCHHFIHEEDEDAADTDLDEDQEGYCKEVAAEELVCDDRIGLQETSYQVRGGFDHDHHHDEDLLQTHVHDLSARLACIYMQDICTFEELEHDGCRDNRSDTEVNDRTTCSGKECTVGSEDICAVGCQSKHRNVRQDKIQN